MDESVGELSDEEDIDICAVELQLLELSSSYVLEDDDALSVEAEEAAPDDDERSSTSLVELDLALDDCTVELEEYSVSSDDELGSTTLLLDKNSDVLDMEADDDLTVLSASGLDESACADVEPAELDCNKTTTDDKLDVADTSELKPDDDGKFGSVPNNELDSIDLLDENSVVLDFAEDEMPLLDDDEDDSVSTPAEDQTAPLCTLVLGKSA